MTTPTERIRALNDQLRRTFSPAYGRIVATDGFMSLHMDIQRRLLQAIVLFEDFTPENDPHGEHDCAVIEAEGQRILFKIDYFDRSVRIHSPDPADPAVTVRVMTIMMAEEY